ncbi:MAG: radical SAM protein [Planctomycetota bacterium]
MTGERPDTDARLGKRLVDDVASSLGPDLAARLERARSESWRRHGRAVTFYSPGMVRTDTSPPRFPAVSITGKRCDLGCKHCAGRLLETMAPAETPEALVGLARELAGRGALGMLVSGGSDACGRLPWGGFLDALKEIKDTTPLRVTVHTALIDPETAAGFARAGVDAALFDVIGSESALRDVFKLEGGIAAVEASLDALAGSGVRLVPHIIIGLEGDAPEGERRAIYMIAARGVGDVSFVIFMPLKGTPLEGARPPALASVAEVLAFARESLPRALHALGCARPRDDYGMRAEAVGLMAGVNRLAVPTGGAERAAEELGLDVTRQETCCSIDLIGDPA